MEKLKVTADECVFIDNQQKNLLIPEKLGMKVIFYNHEEKNIDRLKKELVNLDLNF
jgi:putative hydrolase of the HAD superfamily